MSFIWPQALLLLILIPAGIVLWRRIGLRRAAAMRSRLGPTTAVSPVAGRARGRLPATFILLGVVILTVGLARPQGTIALPEARGTVILAFDVSASMGATDVSPSRLGAAQAAAEAFVRRQPPTVAIGVVAFSDAGASTQAPTTDQATVLAAIKRLAPQSGTSVGRGILAALQAIATAEAGPNTNYYSNRSLAPTPSPTPVPPGTHTSAVVVLMSDGENNLSPDPSAAAQTAADRGIRVYTVGVGTAAGTTLDLNGFQVHTQLEATTLQQIAQATDGTYFSAASAKDLSTIYSHLDTQLQIKPQPIELTAVFAGAGLILLVAGALASLLWLGRWP